MILCVCIGNTNMRLAIGSHDDFIDITIPIPSTTHADDFIKLFESKISDSASQIEGSIISSVVPDMTQFISDAIRKTTKTNPARVELDKLAIDLSSYTSPLGEDRAICCSEAFTQFKKPLLVADLGTATTVNIISGEGLFLGGAIMTGVRTGLTALSEHTAALPLALNLSNTSVIGTNTESCLASGAVFGSAFMLKGYVQTAQHLLRCQPEIIITGGNAPSILPHCDFCFIHKPTLLLEGLFTLFRT